MGAQWATALVPAIPGDTGPHRARRGPQESGL